LKKIILLIVIQKGIIPQYFRKGHEINKSLYHALFFIAFLYFKEAFSMYTPGYILYSGIEEKKYTKFRFFTVLDLQDIFYIPGYKKN
jgi:hypothetical protein